MPSGIAVSASPKLWIRSARSATEPESAKIASWAVAAIARMTRLIATALTPSCDRTIERSTRPCEWPCPFVLVVVRVRVRVAVVGRVIVMIDRL